MERDRLKYTDREIMIASDMDLDDVPEHTQKAILTALRAGKLIEAIKMHREVTGLGLSESKLAVESVRDVMVQQNRSRDSEGGSYGDDVSHPQTVKLVRKNNLMTYLTMLFLVMGALFFVVKIVKYLFVES